MQKSCQIYPLEILLFDILLMLQNKPDPQSIVGEINTRKNYRKCLIHSSLRKVSKAWSMQVNQKYHCLNTFSLYQIR